MDPNSATLQLPKDLIESAIQQHVTLALANSLGDGSRILEQVVKRTLEQKVDSEGKPERYSSQGNATYIQWLVNDALRKAVHAAVIEELSKYQDRIREALAANLKQKNSPLLKQLVEAMTTGMIKASTDKWRLTVNVTGCD